MKLTINTKKGSTEFELPDDATVRQLQTKFHEKNKRFTPERQRFEVEGKMDGKKPLVLSDPSKRLKDYEIGNGTVLKFKDLGPQFGYQATFLVEYFGPIAIHPLFYFGSQIIYGKTFAHSELQTVAMGMVLLHYIKRELETLFVHRFSKGTMPLSNLFKNSSHYWILGGAMVAYDIYRPVVATFEPINPLIFNVALGVWVFAQLSNLYTHLILSSLRPPGSTERKIPNGYGFNLVSCPNYTFEILGWIAFSVLTRSYTAWIFTIVGAGQMAVWAIKKHKEYLRDFPGAYPRGRKILVPFLW